MYLRGGCYCIREAIFMEDCTVTGFDVRIMEITERRDWPGVLRGSRCDVVGGEVDSLDCVGFP